METALHTGTLTFTDKNFIDEVINSPIPVLVDFGAVWCGVCRAILPTIDELAEEFEGRAKIGAVDVDVSPDVSSSYGIRAMPTLIIFKKGEVVDQIIGRISKSELATRLAAHLG